MKNQSKLYQAATVFITCGIALFLLIMAQLLFWVAERTPPFSITKYTVASAARPGTFATVSAEVKRSLERKCSATYSRIFIDSGGVAFDLTEGVRLMTAQALQELDSRSPGKLTFKFIVPSAAAQGKGSIITAMEYACNPIHQLYPVPLVLVSDVVVLGEHK